MTVENYNLQPMTIPVYLLSKGEYITCYNDGETVYKFGFKINSNDYMTMQVTCFDNVMRAYVCLLR